MSDRMIPVHDEEGVMVCENCGKPMSEHDAMAHCWPDPTTRLREARGSDGVSDLRERIEELLDYPASFDAHTFTHWKQQMADAILAALPEHRDDVLAVLGMEQVYANDPLCETCDGDGYVVDVEDAGGGSLDCPDCGPVYAFRPKEQP